MDQCQVCSRKSPVLNDLDCGHYLCDPCVQDNLVQRCSTDPDGNRKVKCVRPGRGAGQVCGQETDFFDVKQISQSIISGSNSESNYDPSVKSMEPELIKLNEEMELQSRLAEEREAEARREIERQKEREAELMYETLLKLSEVAGNCDEICGFRENSAGDKIVIDIQRGTQRVVKDFVQEVLKEDISKFDIVEQSGKASFLLAVGAKIAPAHSFQHLIAQEVHHPDELSNDHVATVTCLGFGTDRKLYALTVKHVFQNGNQQKIISSFHSKLTEVSDSYKGVLSNSRIPDIGGVHLVDIAAMPLKQEIQEELNQNCRDMLYTLNDWYSEPHVKSRQLKGRTVYKYGAATGTTCGVIKYPLCKVKLIDEDGEPLCSGMGFLVESKNPNDPVFAAKGDSGALIWDENSVPIGIVTLAVENYDEGNGNVIPHATFGIRFDCCLKALNMMTGVNIIYCRAFGSPLPLRKSPASDIEFGEPPIPMEQLEPAI